MIDFFKSSILIILLLLSFLTVNVFAEQFSALGTKQISGQASIRYQLQSDLNGSQNSNTFLSSEKISLTFEIDIDSADIGFETSLYLVAQYNGKAYVKNNLGKWNLIDTSNKTLPAFERRTLHASEKITAISDTNLGVGEYLLYTAYKSKTGEIKYNELAASFVIFADDNPALHNIQSNDFLISFLNKARNVSYSKQFDSSNGLFSGATDVAITTPSETSSETSSGAFTSQTNLQEQNVDESDKIKVWQDTLFTLGYCETGEQICSPQYLVFQPICRAKKQECLTTYKMQETPAAAIKLDQILLDDSLSRELYLHNDDGGQTALLLPANSTYSIWSSWDRPDYWQGNTIELSLWDVSQPEKMKPSGKITIDGIKISSRIVGDTLYILSKNSPAYTYDAPISLLSSSDIAPKSSGTFYDDDQETEREKLTAELLLPKIRFDDAEAIALVDATNCYLPVTKSSQVYDQSLLTLTAIPIDKPQNFKSICISGSIETFYMSSKSIYLASSRMDYQFQGNTILYNPQVDYTTDIHKFSFKGTELNYKGSGQVTGHLGWDQDKRSFRFGENKGVLKVATSIGDTWTGSSSTRVGVFKEDAQSRTLVEISHLDNLGKPGERLYASRFIEDKGFLVTFRVTDPLYMLDFSDPYKPQIVGELEIDGYSDYLHPIGENYLLGLGKDAIAAQEAGRGAWYQGVKLSLFDVSEPGNLREVQSVIIGKRGTSSNALYDHHAFTWLDKGNGQATLALPIALHETLPDLSRFLVPMTEDDPRLPYGRTNTGLHVFNIDTNTAPGISLMGKIINDEYSQIEGDRSVIQGDSIHYLHENTMYSSTFNDLDL